MNPAAALLGIVLLAQGLTVGPWSFERLERAHSALEAGRTEEAEELAAEIIENRVLPAYERALGWQTAAYARATRDDAAGAAEAFERCLALDALPPEVARDTRFDLARSYLAAGRAADATRELELWLAAETRPSAEARYLVAAAYAEMGSEEKAIRHARAAVAAKAKAPRSWLELLASLLIMSDRPAEALPTLEALATRFPEPRTWRALAAAYERTDHAERALAVLDLSHRKGWLEDEGALDSLAARYLAAGTPLRAAELLEREIERDRALATVARLELLATSWRLTRDPERAAKALRRALAVAPRGALWLRLGEVELTLGDVHAAQQAFRKGLNDERTREAAERWLEHLASLS